MIKYDKSVREKGNTPMEQAHWVLTEMLRVLDELCQKHNIEYWLTGGTLLGAIRHKGFIPWDDDADIAMTREDYNKFAQIAPKELPEGLYFQFGNVDSRKCKWIKIRDNYSTLIHLHEKDRKVDFHQGIFIDITPYDKTHRDFRRAKMFINRNYQFSLKPAVKKSRWIFNQLATIPVKLIGINRLRNHYLKKFGKKETKFISTGIDIPHFYYNYPPSTIFPIKKVEFNGIQLSAPNDFDHYLKVMFGDYMKLPPKEKQVGHHVYKVMPFTKCNHPSAQDY